jgi:hypothetical protein
LKPLETSDLIEASGDQWHGHQEFRDMAAVVQNLSVVNDVAECSVKDIQEYAHAKQDRAHRERIILVSGSQGVEIISFLKNESKENLSMLLYMVIIKPRAFIDYKSLVSHFVL